MTEPMNRLTPPPVPEPVVAEPTWWQRNRAALLAMLPLLVLAVLASSYRYQTLYRPNEFTRPQVASGRTLDYHETFQFKGFGEVSEPYQRNVTLTVTSVTPVSGHQGEQAAKGAALWLTILQFQASPDVPLDDCQVALIDTEGREYGTQGGKTGANANLSRLPCVPADTPGPTFDFTGKLSTSGPERPVTWTIRRAIALPEGRQPKFVRVSWETPDYALIPVN